MASKIWAGWTWKYAGLLIVGLGAWLVPQVPLPWSWLAGMATGAGAGSIVWLDRRHHRRKLEYQRRIHQLEADRSGLRAREEMHDALLASLPVGVLAVRSGRPVYANQTAAEFLGRRITQPGAPIPNPVRRVIEEATDGRSSTSRLTRGLPRRVIEVSGHPAGSDGVAMLHLLDITERVQADRIRQDFVVAASHELKTPVAAIQAAAETVLVALETDPEAVLDFTGRIYDNAVRMSRIVTDLLDLSRLESTTPRVEPFDLAEVLTSEVHRFSSARPPIAFEAVPTPMVGNPSDLALAFRNLLDNAVRHTAKDGRVTASVGISDGVAIVTVADTGSGIPAAELPRIFERFYRVDEARSRATGGTGLGLAIVKHVAELHGGRVEVESRLGEGSTFRIQVPLVAPPSGEAVLTNRRAVLDEA